MSRSHSRLRAACVVAAMLLFGAACSASDDSGAGGAPAQPQQEVAAPTRDSAAADPGPADPAPADVAIAADEQEPDFAACAWERSLPVPVAADVDDLAAKWDAAAASVAPDVLTSFDVSTAYSATDENRIADGVANYVGDRAFLVGVSRTEDGVDAASLLVDPNSPVIDDAVRAFVTAILGSDAPEDAGDQVVDSLTLWPNDGRISETIVHHCFWHTSRQPLSTADDDWVYVLGVVAAETASSANNDVTRWLNTEENRTVGTLFVRDARRWNGQSED